MCSAARGGRRYRVGRFSGHLAANPYNKLIKVLVEHFCRFASHPTSETSSAKPSDGERPAEKQHEVEKWKTRQAENDFQNQLKLLNFILLNRMSVRSTRQSALKRVLQPWLEYYFP